MLHDMVTAADAARDAGVPNGTKSANRWGFKWAVRFGDWTGNRWMRPREAPGYMDKLRETYYFALLLIWVTQNMQPAKRRKEQGYGKAMPTSGLLVVYALARVTRACHRFTPDMGTVLAVLKGLCAMYKKIWGDDALVPCRKQPYSRPQLLALVQALCLKKIREWTGTLHDAMLVLICYCLSTGTRKDEWAESSDGDSYVRRGNFAWVDDNGADPPSTPDVIASRRNGHLLRGRSAPSKCDRLNVEWGAQNQWFRYDDSNPLNFAWRWSQWEHKYPCPPHERARWPAFSPWGDSRPFRARQADAWLRVLLIQVLGEAAAAVLSWHAFRVTIAMALLASRNHSIMRDEVEGVIQTLVRWKTVEALRIYARMKPNDYADFVDLATKTDASLAHDQEPPETGPQAIIAEHEAAIAALAQAEKSKKEDGRPGGRSDEGAHQADAAHATTRDAKRARKKTPPREQPLRAPPPAATYYIGEGRTVEDRGEDRWAVTGRDVSLPNTFWGVDDGEHTTCTVVGYIGRFDFAGGGPSPHTFIIEHAGYYYPARHTAVRGGLMDPALKRRVKKSGAPRARRQRRTPAVTSPPPSLPASPPHDDAPPSPGPPPPPTYPPHDDMPPPDAPSPPSSPPWGDPNAVASMGAATQQLCHELELIGTTEAAAWARRLQGPHALEASREHMPLQRAVAALCNLLYERQPGTITKIAIIAAICMRLDDLTGGSIRAAFGINRSTFDAARGRLLASGVMDALTLATAALDFFKERRADT